MSHYLGTRKKRYGHDTRSLEIQRLEFKICITCKHLYNLAAKAKKENNVNYKNLYDEYIACKEKTILELNISNEYFLKIINGGKI